MISIIHTPTNELQQSLNFYKRLNYTVISTENPTLLSDGKFILEINPDRYARPGVKLFKNTWNSEVQQLERLTPLYPIENGYLLNDLNGTWIYLIEGEPDFSFATAPQSHAITGNFAGLSIESANIARSSEIWKSIGFSLKTGTAEQGWASLNSEDGLVVNLMKPLSCPHLFFNPSLTFFNGKNNLAIIEKIRDAGIPITEEITFFNKENIVDNIIIRDPGGYGFFIYND